MLFLFASHLILELSRVMRRLFEGVKEKLLTRICAGELCRILFNVTSKNEYNESLVAVGVFGGRALDYNSFARLAAILDLQNCTGLGAG